MGDRSPVSGVPWLVEPERCWRTTAGEGPMWRITASPIDQTRRRFMTATKVARPSNRVVQRVLTDGEYVVNHSLILEEGGPAAVRFDVWRIANGVVAEHWADEERW